MNLLEAIRHCDPEKRTSTNKVYGALNDIAFEEELTRYAPATPGIEQGIDESRLLEFHGPYGCSKGATDQCVSTTPNLRPQGRRLPDELHLWSAAARDRGSGLGRHFLIRSLDRTPVIIYGDGRQVRDLLHIDDLGKRIAASCVSTADRR